MSVSQWPLFRCKNSTAVNFTTIDFEVASVKGMFAIKAIDKLFLILSYIEQSLWHKIGMKFGYLIKASDFQLANSTSTEHCYIISFFYKN